MVWLLILVHIPLRLKVLTCFYQVISNDGQFAHQGDYDLFRPFAVGLQAVHKWGKGSAAVIGTCQGVWFVIYTPLTECNI